MVFTIPWLTSSLSPTVTQANNDQAYPQMVTISVPLNTTIVGGLVTRRELRISSDLIFADFYLRICAGMDLNPSEASIGYKFHTDRARDVPRELSNESGYLAVVRGMVHKVRASRTRNPVPFLRNLVRPCLPVWKVVRPYRILAQRPATHTPVSKRKQDDESTDECRPRPPAALGFTRECRELHSRLRRRLHGGRPCQVNPVTAEHNELNICQLTLWARMIVCPAHNSFAPG